MKLVYIVFVFLGETFALKENLSTYSSRFKSKMASPRDKSFSGSFTDTAIVEILTVLNQRVNDLERLRSVDAQLLTNMRIEIQSLKKTNDRLSKRLGYFSALFHQHEQRSEPTPLDVQRSELMTNDTRNKDIELASNGSVDISRPSDIYHVAGYMSNGNRIRPSNIPSSHKDKCGTNQVAFYAILTAMPGNPRLKDNVIFNNAITNIGKSYDNNTGIFICSVPGLYVISWEITVWNDQYLHTSLRKNGNPVGYSNTAGTGHAGSSSRTAILLLDTSDVIEVVIDAFSSDSSLYISSNFNAFSGFKLD